MNGLKKITYNCKKATFLIEKKRLDKITLVERLQLNYHLAGCRICRIFDKQSAFIDQLIYKLTTDGTADEHALDDDFKKELQQMIDERTEQK